MCPGSVDSWNHCNFHCLCKNSGSGMKSLPSDYSSGTDSDCCGIDCHCSGTDSGQTDHTGSVHSVHTDSD